MGEFESRSVKTRDAVDPSSYEGTENMFYFFYKIILFRLNKKEDVRSAYVHFHFFHETEDTQNMFYFFYKIIFLLNKEKDDVRSACVYFNFFHENVNSYNLETAKHIDHVIFVLHSAVKTLF